MAAVPPAPVPPAPAPAPPAPRPIPPPPQVAPAPDGDAPTPTPTPGALQQLHIEPWVDPVIDTVGHDPRSAYVERFWLGVLGPSTILLFRRLAVAFDHHPDGFPLDVQDTAAALGLTGKDRRDGSRSPVVKALDRSCTFGVARSESTTTFLVRKRFPPLTRRQLEHLPDATQLEHRQWLERDARRPLAAQMRARARRLALSLLELGETYDDAEHQLHRWQFHPAVAHDAVKWAHTEHLDRGAPETDAAPTPLRGHDGRPVITRLAAPNPEPSGDAA